MKQEGIFATGIWQGSRQVETVLTNDSFTLGICKINYVFA
jgi:hypothetical protein